MIGAGLLAKKAVEKGLSVNPAVKTSLAPGSRVVTDYLNRAGLTPYLEALQFHAVGYGCTTCIGNSGPLPDEVAQAVQDNNLVVAAVLSGNRNFEARIHPQVRASYLASPPLVVAFALAGRVDIDLTTDPIGLDPNGSPVYLKDLWPTQAEVREAMNAAVGPDQFLQEYAEVFDGDEHWQALPLPERGDLFGWDPQSTYVQEPPFFDGLTPQPGPLTDIENARVLVMLGDSITTDHVSPAGSIPKDAPSGRYLIEHGVALRDFNSYGARRGNHQVMMRGTFGNVRLRNELVPDREGDWTLKLPPDWVLAPQGEVQRIFDAAMQYQTEGVPLVGIAGKEYGSGSSRDWAAKGHAAAWHPRGHRGELRAHPPQQPGRHGCPAAAVHGRDPAIARLDRPRDVQHWRHRRWATTRADAQRPRSASRRQRVLVRRGLSNRHPDRGRVLPPRRHPALRAAAPAGGGRCLSPTEAARGKGFLR